MQLAVGSHVALRLGNKRKQALDSYIDPTVFPAWDGLKNGWPPGPESAPDISSIATPAQKALVARSTPERREFFHRTDAGDAIRSSGVLRPGARGAYGPGVYLSSEEDDQGSLMGGEVLKVSVDLQRVLDQEDADKLIETFDFMSPADLRARMLELGIQGIRVKMSARTPEQRRRGVTFVTWLVALEDLSLGRK